ncbi:MAG: VCBS repeat-containing protein [Bacteroidetes bacterium]|nr:VCBS repeat-containing protein [Bacteroidota bacterium]
MPFANQGSNTVSIRLGDGIGNFSGSNNMSIGSVPTSVAVGDYDADGKQDLAIANYNSANVSIYLGASNEINILSNGNIIAYGSSSVSIMNNTDFRIYWYMQPG